MNIMKFVCPGVVRFGWSHFGDVTELLLKRSICFLQFVDKEGRTPLMIACQRGELFDMVLTLLNLGANVKAYQPGMPSTSKVG